jgi:exocyst complex component 1
MLASVERFMAEVDGRQNAFFLRLLERQHVRMKNRFDRHVQEQIKAVEKTRLTAKKREGVAHFIKFFPIYLQRVEAQLVGINVLEIRKNVDLALERIVDAMFDTLQQMARIEGDQEEKEKGQLNYHVILIGRPSS